MSTHSNIMMMNDDSSVSGIYCHWDGYLENVGKVLSQSYQDRTKVRRLMDLGDISILGNMTRSSPFVRALGFDWELHDPFMRLKDLEDKPMIAFKQAAVEANQYFTTAYHRDRGEKKSQMHISSLNDVPLCEYSYLYLPDKFRGDRWYYYDDSDYDESSVKRMGISDPRLWHSLKDKLIQLQNAENEPQYFK